ncbi:NADH dehydrogenase [ubiquinone] 1 subunit C2 [Trichoplusia ni]|uniref:NADH dehydrogenase [ubiquinone] 1 subunit C2 n=1 Tax=Trichoplusia ni TaxID=7111 RepID=A0A7E5VXK5_TRINI|nr:NADH dehydrogenase [ubiquinone] 1 subunit C2 [Trichoplusia ni]
MSSQMTAIELLELGDEGRKRPLLNQHWPSIIGSIFGVCTGIFINFQTRRPVFSGIHQHVILSAGFVTALTLLNNKRDAYFAEKDAVYRHYIELHPEEFEEPEPKKIGDLLEPWIPIR